MISRAVIIGVVVLGGCSSIKANLSEGAFSLDAEQKRATQFNSVVSLPVLEKTVEAMQRTVADTVKKADAELRRIGTLEPKSISFETTIRALDDLGFMVELVASRIEIIKETSPSKAMRDAAEPLLEELQKWAVKAEYDEDVFRVVEMFRKQRPQLSGEDKRLFDEIIRDYRRAGFKLKPDARKKVEELRKEVVALEIKFQTNINNAKPILKFSRSDLQGVPEGFVNSLKTGDDEYSVNVNNPAQSVIIRNQCRVEETRKRLVSMSYNVARSENLPVIRQIVAKRAEIAKRLGYANWADYQTETKMAKNGKTAKRFLTDLTAKLAPKFRSELVKMRRMKIADTNNPKAKVEIWDVHYYWEQINQREFGIDTESLRVFFPMDHVLQGMFDVFGEVFGIRIQQVTPPDPWVPELKLLSVADLKTAEPLGFIYIDPFPRDGKFNHFAKFGMISGKQLADGRYHRPVAALICNFQPPASGKPSLMSHTEVETLFHEFGHALHSVMTRAKYSRFSGTSVPRDFVEVPSQMLEHWAWDRDVLNRFAADYRDPSRKIPKEVLDTMWAAKISNSGGFYRRQMAFGLLDMSLHMLRKVDANYDIIAKTNTVLDRVFLPVPPDTAFITSFGHLCGYDAGYYGYAWSDVISADLATAFEKSPRRFMDSKIGLRLRKEIYEPGNSRDPNVSVKAFLMRPASNKAFLKELGIK